MNKEYDFVIFAMGYLYVQPRNDMRGITFLKIYDKTNNSNITEASNFSYEEYYKKYVLSPNRALGAYSVANFLRKKGYTVKCIDFLNNFTLEEVDKLAEKYISEKTLAVGFSLSFGNWHMDPFEKDFFDRVERIKNKTGKRIVAGGHLSPIGSFKDQERFNQLIDNQFMEKSERSLLTLLEGIKINKVDLTFKMNRIIKSSIFPNSKEDDTDLSLILSKEDDDFFYGESFAIELARGCIFDCNFCSYEKKGQKNFDYLIKQEQLYNTLKHNYDNFGVVNYNIIDPTFNDSTQKLQMVSDVVDRLDFKPRFTGFLRTEIVIRYPEQIDLLANIGFECGIFGVETFHPLAQKAIRKKINFDDLIDMLTKFKEKIPNFDAFVSMIVGLPYETADHFEKMLRLLVARPDLVSFVGISPLYLETGNLENITNISNFSLHAEDHGYIRGDKSWSNESNQMTSQIANNHCRDFREIVATMHTKPKSGAFLHGYNHFLDENQLGITVDNFASKYKEKVLSN